MQYQTTEKSHSTVKKIVINRLSTFLHIQHQFTTIIFHFCKLFKIKIFPKAALHTKNTTIEGVVMVHKDYMQAIVWCWDIFEA
jgi:hypothetical protein